MLEKELYGRVSAAVPPYTVLRDLGCPLFRKTGRDGTALFWTPHPKYPDTHLYLAGKEFVEPSKTSGFWGGGALHYTILKHGGGVEGIKWFLDKYRDRIAGLSNYETSYLAEWFYGVYIREKKINQWLSSLVPNYTDTSKFVAAASWIRNLSSQSGHTWADPLLHWLYLAGEGEVESFLQQVYGRNRPPFQPEGSYLVLPFFTSWGSLSHLRFSQPWESENGSPSWVVPIYQSRVAFAGWHGSRVWSPTFPAVITTSLQQGITLNAVERSKLSKSAVLLLDVNAKIANPEIPKLTSSTVFYVNDHTSIESLGVLADVTGKDESLTLCTTSPEDPVQKHTTLLVYLVALAKSIIEDDASSEDLYSSPRLSALFYYLKPEVTNKLVGELIKIYPQHSRTLQEFRPGPGMQHFAFAKASVSGTRHGYDLYKDDSPRPELITNYTLAIRHNAITGMGNGEIYICGNVHMGNDSFPVNFIKSQCSKAKYIEDTILGAFSHWNRKRERLNEDQRVPVTFSADGLKYLPSIVQRASADVPFQEGYENLGWQEDGTHFVSPGWSRRDLEYIYTPSEIIASSPVFQWIENSNLQNIENVQLHTLPEECNHPVIIAALLQILTWTIRCGRGYPVQPMLLRDAPAFRNMLRGILFPFGQQEIPILNPSSRRKTVEKLFPNMKSYPLGVVTGEPEMLMALDYPLFVLSNNDIGKDLVKISKESQLALAKISLMLLTDGFDLLSIRGHDLPVAYKPESQSLETEALLNCLLATRPDDKILAKLSEGISYGPIEAWVKKHQERIPKDLYYSLEHEAYIWKVRGTGMAPPNGTWHVGIGWMLPVGEVNDALSRVFHNTEGGIPEIKRYEDIADKEQKSNEMSAVACAAIGVGR